MEERAERSDDDDLRLLARLFEAEASEEEEDAAAEEPILLLEDGASPAPAGEETPTLDGQRIATRYELLRLVAHGPNGDVYLAKDHEQQGREVALKLLDVEQTASPDFPEFVERARILFEKRRRLRHESVNTLRDIGRAEDDRVYVVSDYLQGESLRSLLDRRGSLQPRQALEIARQILAGLEHGHALGLAHGSLHLGNVLLADRVAWSPENPFAVGVRMLDYGLSSLTRSGETVPNLAADLVAAGRMLAELLMGLRLQPDASDWMGSHGSVATAHLSSEIRSVLDRSLSSRAEERFASAHDFRTAIEKAPEIRGRRVLSSTGARILVLCLVSLGLTATIWFGRSSDDPVQAAEDTTAASDSPVALLPVPRPNPSGVTLALEPEGPEEPAVAAGPGPERAALPGVAPTVEAETEDREAAAELLDAGGLAPAEDREAEVARPDSTELQALREENRRWRDHITSVDDELREARLKLQKMEELEAARRWLREEEAARVTPDARDELGELRALAADYLGTILVEIESQDAAGARGTFQRWQEEPSLAATSLGGPGFVDAWTRACALRQDLANADDDDLRVRLLGRTSDELSAALEGWPRFENDAAAWLELARPEGEAARSARIAESLRELELALAREAGSLEGHVRARWDALSNESADLPPAEILPLARWMPGDALEGFVSRYDSEVRVRASWDDRLDLAGLAHFLHLEEWARTLADPELDFDPSETAAAATRSLLRLASAQRFFLSEPEAREEALLRPPGLVPGERAPAWLEDLVLRVELLASGTFPAAAQSRRLYRLETAGRTTAFSWTRVEESALTDEGDQIYRLAESHVLRDGTLAPPTERTVRRNGRAFFEEGLGMRELFDLASLEGWSLRSWLPLAVRDLPPGLELSAAELEAYRMRLTEAPWTCLVWTTEEGELWLSPELGLVREESAGRVRELVFEGPDR